MSALRERPDRRQLARISVEDFHRGSEIGIYGKRAELIHGVVFQKPPMSPLHQKLPKRLYDHLLRAALPGVSVRHESSLQLLDSEPLPDVAIAAGGGRRLRRRNL